MAYLRKLAPIIILILIIIVSLYVPYFILLRIFSADILEINKSLDQIDANRSEIKQCLSSISNRVRNIGQHYSTMIDCYEKMTIPRFT